MQVAENRANGKRVFIVEDESMIRMLLESMLDELGYSVTAAAGHIDEAVQLAASSEFDLAILDVNLNGHAVSPVADAIKARGLPYVFATGYDERGLPEAYRGHPTLQKPFQQDALERMLNAMLG